MTTEIELLPLPKWMSNYTIPHDSSVLHEDVRLVDRMHDYARANITNAIAPLQAEIERDEALLRQALEALGRAHQTAMEQTLGARVPECSAFAEIAQDLDFIVAALRERLGEKA